MPVLLQVLICSLAGGVLSLVGGLLLLASKKRVKLAEYATAFAAGALLASAFVDIIPEAMEDGDGSMVSILVLVGLIAFFVLEIALGWFHQHGAHGHDESSKSKAVIPMVIIGDTLHNFIDGIAIAAGFLVSPASGIIVTLAVAAHEIPQEVGDFGLLLHNGLSRKRVLIVNILSSLATTVSAVIFYLLGSNLDISFGPLLGLVAGFFIYIAASDIIPSIHASKTRNVKFKKMITLIAGAAIISVAVVTLHGIAHQYSGHDHHIEKHNCGTEDDHSHN